jgi:hypothetical protein
MQSSECEHEMKNMSMIERDFFHKCLPHCGIVCFTVFYEAYLSGAVEREYQGVDVSRMTRAVWCDLINALLWFGSAIFSSAMCCAGVKAAARNRLEKRRERKNKNQSTTQKMEAMESGLIGATPR